jgi:intraflagellar transport protein 81
MPPLIVSVDTNEIK